MPASIVISIRSENSGSLLNSNGLILHAAWYKRWAQLDQSQAVQLHQTNPQIKPFTISPLMDLASDPFGVCHFKAGQTAWFRVTTLTDELSDGLATRLFNRQEPSVIEMKGSSWRVVNMHTRSDEHDWAGKLTYAAMIQIAQETRANRQWTLEFATPTAINGDHFVFPFPTPEALVRSWLRKWQTYGTVPFSAALPEAVRERISIEAYSLDTEGMRFHGQKWPGCVGSLTLEEHGLKPDQLIELKALMLYSFFCGSGYKTTQGMGQTRLIMDG